MNIDSQMLYDLGLHSKMHKNKMNETITTTMTRKQRFQLQDPSWVDGIDLNHANNIIEMYEKLPDYQKNIFIDHFDEYINMSDLALFFYTEAMRGHKQVIDNDGKLLNLFDQIYQVNSNSNDKKNGKQ